MGTCGTLGMPVQTHPRRRNDEDYGWNLFAQHAVDNSHLGHCLVSCAEAGHVGAHHVRCTQGKECVHRCS